MRAMFDRIAGVYDRMNTVMTAGPGPRWRRRAADLAAVGPGRSGARRGHRNRRPGAGAGGPGGAGRGGRGLGLLRGDAGARAREKAAGRPSLRVGQRAGAALRRRAPSTRRRSASARATSPTWTAGWARWRGSCGPAAGWWSSRSPRRSGRRCRGSTRVWFDRLVPLLGRVAGDPDAYSYLPNSVRRFPGPRELAAPDGGRRAAATCAGSSPPAGSSPSTRAQVGG